MIRALRNLYKEFASFGKPELEKLRDETKKLQEQLIQLRAAREERERQLEVLAIARLRATVEQMKQMDSVTKAAEDHVKHLVDDLGESARPRMQAAIAAEVQEKAQAAMKGMNLDDLLGEPSASSASQPQSGSTGQQDAAAASAERAAQSPAAAAVRGGGNAQPAADTEQSGNSSASGSGIGGDNDIISKLRRRSETTRGKPA